MQKEDDVEEQYDEDPDKDSVAVVADLAEAMKPKEEQEVLKSE